MFLTFLVKHWSSLLMGAAVAALFFFHPPLAVLPLLKLAVLSHYLALLNVSLATQLVWFLFTALVFLVTSSVVILGHELLDLIRLFPVQATRHPWNEKNSIENSNISSYIMEENESINTELDTEKPKPHYTFDPVHEILELEVVQLGVAHDDDNNNHVTINYK